MKNITSRQSAKLNVQLKLPWLQASYESHHERYKSASEKKAQIPISARRTTSSRTSKHQWVRIALALIKIFFWCFPHFSDLLSVLYNQ
jgi:hypothetical protein